MRTFFKTTDSFKLEAETSADEAILMRLAELADQGFPPALRDVERRGSRVASMSFACTPRQRPMMSEDARRILDEQMRRLAQVEDLVAASPAIRDRVTEVIKALADVR